MERQRTGPDTDPAYNDTEESWDNPATAVAAEEGPARCPGCEDLLNSSGECTNLECSECPDSEEDDEDEDEDDEFDDDAEDVD